MKISFNKLILILLFIVSPFFDSLTGFLVLSKVFSEAFLGSPSQLIRAVIFFLIMLTLKDRTLILLLLALLIFGILETVYAFYHESFVGYAKGVLYDYKILYIYVLILFLKKYLNSSSTIDSISPREALHKYILYTVFVYAILLLIPRVLGVGFSTYDEGTFGSKGFFPSQNGLGVFLGVVINLSIYAFWQSSYRALLYRGGIILGIISLVLLGTKTAIIFTLFSFFHVYLKTRSSIKYIVLMIIGAFIILKMATIWSASQIIFDVVVWRYQHADSIGDFIFSGRNKYVLDAFNTYNIDSFPLRVIIGFGSFVSFQDPTMIIESYDTLETDLFDIFFSYGLVGVVGYFYIIFKGIYRSVLVKNYSYFVIWMLLCLHSVFAGHVIFASFSALSVALLYSLINDEYYADTSRV